MSILEHVIHTDLIKESKHSSVFVGRLDDSSKVIIKLLKNADIKIFQTLSSVNSLHFPRILELSERTENGEPELTVIEEYIEGENVSDLLNTRKLSSEEMFQLMLQLCEGISFLHQMNPPFIHRDIKPQNLILTKDGVLKIIDFNTTRVYKPDASDDTIHLGTVEYAPPEQFGYSQTDVRSDIYSIGVTLYEIVYGKKFKLKNTKQLLAPSGLDSIIAHCTMYDPEQRYQSVQELQADLIHYQKANTLYKHKPRKIIYLIAAGIILAAVLLMVLCIRLPGARPVSSIEPVADTTAEAAAEPSTAVTPETTTTASPTAEETSTHLQTTATPEPTAEPLTTGVTETSAEPPSAATPEAATEAPTTAQEATAQPQTTVPTQTTAAMEPKTSFPWPASLIINQESDTVEFRFPNIPDSRIEQIQLLDTAGVLFATIEVRHNPSSPRLVSFNTAMRINGTATYDLSSFSLAKTENSTITLSFNSSVILGKPAAALTGFTYNVTSTALPKLPAPADMQWDSSNPGYAFWTSPYQCVQFHSVNGQATGYNTNLKKDGNNRYYRGMTDIIQKKSATYQMMAMALGDWENGDSDVVSTEPLVYTIPETKLPVVTGLHFEGTTIFFNTIEGVTEYHIELYGIDKSTGQWVQAKHARMVQTNFSDIQSWLKQEAGKYDKFGVRVNAVSPDLMNIAAGEVSELCIYGE